MSRDFWFQYGVLLFLFMIYNRLIGDEFTSGTFLRFTVGLILYLFISYKIYPWGEMK